MEVTAGEPVREECLKGRLDRFGVFALVRGQVSSGDERRPWRRALIWGRLKNLMCSITPCQNFSGTSKRCAAPRRTRFAVRPRTILALA
jgi:hypothetical protein